MERIRIDKIRLDGGTQPRAKLNDERVAEYTENLQAGAVFPPVEVVYDGQDYWLWDGFHRVHACRAANLAKVEANVIPGTQADAQWLSYSANKAHGLYRSNEDKRRAVEAAMAHPKAESLSNVLVAEHCGVSEFLVRRLREKSTSIKSKSPVRAGRDGRTIDTSNIGKTARKTARKTKPAPLARDAYMPVRGHSSPAPMVPLSLPLQNPEIAANTLIELFETDWLRCVAERLAKHLDSLHTTEGA